MTTFKDAFDELRAAQKPAARSAPAYSRFVNRRLGRPLAAAAAAAGLTPNQVTWISAAATWSGIAVVALVPAGWVAAVAATVLLVLGYALDSADGQLARLQGSGSTAGEWLDHVVDAVKTVALPLAVLVSLSRVPEIPRWWLVVPLVAAVASTVLFFAMILTEQLRRAHGVRSVADSAEGPMQWVRAVLVLPMDYGVLCWSFLALGSPVVFAWVYGAITAFTTAFVVAAWRKWYREMVGLGR
jgi:phosphatidylglycerophosphate synthase